MEKGRNIQSPTLVYLFCLSLLLKLIKFTLFMYFVVTRWLLTNYNRGDRQNSGLAPPTP